MALTVVEFKALMAARTKRDRGEALTEDEQALLAANPDPPKREPELSLGDMADELEKLGGLPECDGFVFLAGVPRRLGLRR